MTGSARRLWLSGCGLRTAQRQAAVAVLTVAGALLPSCEPSHGDSRPRPSSPPVIEVILREYSFRLSRPLPAGRVVFRLRNVGKEPHRPALLRLDEGFPPIQEQVRGEKRRFLLPFAGVDTRPPRSVGTFAVDLLKGQRYALVCFVAAPDGQGHAYKGMTWESRAGEGATSSVPASRPLSGRAP